MLFRSNRKRFARLVGLPGALAETDVPDNIPAPRFSAEVAGVLAATVLRDNARSTLEFEIAELRIRDAQLRINSEKVRLYPKFFASAGLSLENSTNVNGNTVSQQGIQRRNVSVYAQWNIFDGFATRAAIREAQASKRVQERHMPVLFVPPGGGRNPLHLGMAGRERRRKSTRLDLALRGTSPVGTHHRATRGPQATPCFVAAMV